jgi:hypothetical protein
MSKGILIACLDGDSSLSHDVLGNDSVYKQCLPALPLKPEDLTACMSPIARPDVAAIKGP